MPALSPRKVAHAAFAGTWLTAAVLLEMARRDLQTSRGLRERPGTSEPLLDVIAEAGDLLAAFQEAIAAEAYLSTGRRGRRRRRRRD